VVEIEQVEIEQVEISPNEMISLQIIEEITTQIEVVIIQVEVILLDHLVEIEVQELHRL